VSGCLFRGVRDRDVALEPTWMYSRRPRKRHPDTHAVAGIIFNEKFFEIPACAGMTEGEEFVGRRQLGLQGRWWDWDVIVLRALK